MRQAAFRIVAGVLAGEHTFMAVYKQWLTHRRLTLEEGRQTSMVQIPRIFENDVFCALNWPYPGLRAHARHAAHAPHRLADTDIDDYEIVVFDGGNTRGDTWKHVFFPRQREHCFVYAA